MKKEFLLFFASLLFSVIFAIVFLEIYFKNDFWSGNFFTHNGRNHNTQFDSKLGWSNTPEVSYIEDDITYTFNSSGFRSKEIDLSKKHILVIGDSIALGYGVQDDETLPYYLSGRFKEYQILNMGVVGYGVDQYYLNLKKHIHKLNPAIIVIVICMANDLEETRIDVGYGKSKPLFIIDKNKLELKSGQTQKIDPNNIVLINSNIPPNSCHNFFTKSWTLKQSIFKGFRESFCETRSINTVDLQYVLLSLFFKFTELAKENNSKIIFALSPPEIKNMKEGGNMGEDDVFHITFFQNMFRGIRFPYVDFFEVINKQNLDSKKLYVDGLHYTPLGNKLFADSIFKTIEANKMVPLKLNNELGT
jgi:lysophospholipase L1-like esterase